MKLSMKWGSKNQKPKACKAPQKIRWDLLGIPDPRKEPPPNSIEEIRRQAQVISSRVLGQGVRIKTEEKDSKGGIPSNTAKGVRKSKRRTKEF